jgi:RNA polymerase sigma-70 factor (ECF subfamily)
MTEAPSTSLSLLDRVRAADPDAWGRLVDVYGPLVYGWALRAGLQPADAADVGQEVFAAVARGIRTFRRDRPTDSFRGWLFVITRRKVADHFAARPDRAEGGTEALRRLGEVAAESDGSGDDSSGEVRALYRRAIKAVRDEFEPATWQAAWRVAVDGERPADVAAALGMSVNAVYLAKSRVLRRLRAEFTGFFDWADS